MIWFFKRKPLAGLTGVGAVLTARHIPPHEAGEVHEPSWEVTAWFEDRGHDAMPYQRVLVRELAPYQGKILPHYLSRGEALASWICGRLDDCVRVDVSRHDERLYARWPA